MPEHVNPEQANSELLTAENLTKVFTIRHGFSSTAFSAVDEATFSIDASTPEILTIAGESGSGKTTLARMILGMERVSSGILRYKGRDITRLTNKEKRSWFYQEVQGWFRIRFTLLIHR